MRETYVAVAGIVATDPQVRTLDDGRQVMSFRVASTSRRFDGQTRAWVDGHTFWVRVTCWRELADNASQCVRKRDRVLAWGRLHTEQWKGADGWSATTWPSTPSRSGTTSRSGSPLFNRKRRAVDQRTLTDVPVVDPDTGEIIGVPPGAAGRTPRAAGRPAHAPERACRRPTTSSTSSTTTGDADAVDGVEDPEEDEEDDDEPYAGRLGGEGDRARALVGSADRAEELLAPA